MLTYRTYSYKNHPARVTKNVNEKGFLIYSKIRCFY